VAEITAEAVKSLRNLTGAGVMDCKRALQEAQGDQDKAQVLLKYKGVASAAKRAGKSTDEGVVDAYIHSGGRIGALVELNCETDFVARTEEFLSLVHDLALQVAAMSPVYVSQDDLPPGSDLNPEEVCLLQQPFIKDPAVTIQDLVSGVIAKTGENIQVGRFTRFALGQE
jgi:elongation factor Ts